MFHLYACLDTYIWDDVCLQQSHAYETIHVCACERVTVSSNYIYLCICGVWTVEHNIVPVMKGRVANLNTFSKVQPKNTWRWQTYSYEWMNC